jgi:acyl-CoA thioester hydrolase
MSMPAIPEIHREDFPKLVQISTRWADNDIYLHVNNVVYFSFFDTAVNQTLVENNCLQIEQSDVVGLVVNNQCQFFASIAFPDIVTVGVSVEKIGNSSVTYRLGIFKNQEDTLCALGSYTHVYVDRSTHRPVSIPQATRALFQSLLVIEKKEA